MFWKACGLSSPGTLVTMLSPGLNPSLVLMPAGLMWTPFLLAGRRRVAEVHPHPRWSARVGHGVVVAREREQAVGPGAGDDLAPLRSRQRVALRHRLGQRGVPLGALALLLLLFLLRSLRPGPSRSDSKAVRATTLQDLPAGRAEGKRDLLLLPGFGRDAMRLGQRGTPAESAHRQDELAGLRTTGRRHRRLPEESSAWSLWVLRLEGEREALRPVVLLRDRSGWQCDHRGDQQRCQDARTSIVGLHADRSLDRPAMRSSLHSLSRTSLVLRRNLSVGDVRPAHSL